MEVAPGDLISMTTRKFRGNPRKVKAYVGLGSNEGDRVGFVQQAVALLKDIPQITVFECSSLYETEPIGDEYSQWFVNAVVSIETGLSCEELLDVLKDIETRLAALHSDNVTSITNRGRLRIMDLDILFFGDEVVETEDLIVPHPRLHLRAFALVPLLELAPDMVHPKFHKTVAELHEELPEPEQVLLYGLRKQSEGHG